MFLKKGDGHSNQKDTNVFSYRMYGHVMYSFMTSLTLSNLLWVAAVNFSMEVCFDFSQNGEKRSCPQQCCFLRCNYFSVWSSWRQAIRKSVSQENYKFEGLWGFSFYSIFALECFCVLLLHIWHVCYLMSEWSTINGLCRCIFVVLRVSGFNGLHYAPGPFLLWQTTICHDEILFTVGFLECHRYLIQ